MTKVPELRFDGFDEEWEERKLYEVVNNIGTGKSKFNLRKDARYPVLGSTGIIGYSDTFDYNGKYILVARVGANAGSIYDYIGQVNISDNTIFIETNNRFFLKNQLNYINLRKFVFGSGQPLVKSSDLKNLNLNFPINEFEQEKIGDLFSKIDQLIESQQALVDKTMAFKKSMLQKMFARKDSLVPEFRFDEYTDDWRIIKVSNIYSKAGSGGTPKSSVSDYYNGDIPFLSVSDISNSDGNIYETQKYITQRGLENSAAWVVPAESISLAMYASVGKVAKTKVNLATSQAFFNLIVADSYDTEFIYQYFKKMDLFNEWRSFVITGTQPNLNASIINNYKLKIPSLEEQEKIGNFFKNLDEKIAKEEKLLELYKDMKKSLLQKMFV